MKKFLVHIYISLKAIRENFRIHKAFDLKGSCLEARIIRYLHGIEKGLSLENPRTCFGTKKIESLFGFIEEYKSLNCKNNLCLLMCRDAIKEYLDFHADLKIENEQIKWIRQKWQELDSYLPSVSEKFGGISKISKDQMQFNVTEIERLFNTRHSIREFSGEKIAEEDIKKAIRLAQTCPSACNRQCTRVYSVTSEKYINDMKTNLEGIGGFANDVDRFLLICAKKTAYELDEIHQYVVSASIFAGYLTLALHTYGMAACMVQRTLLSNPLWENFQKINNIPEDEQIIAMIAVGKYKEVTKVPISKRFPVEDIYKNLSK